jgi:hypothetical protein
MSHRQKGRHAPRNKANTNKPTYLSILPPLQSATAQVPAVAQAAVPNTEAEAHEPAATETATA